MKNRIKTLIILGICAVLATGCGKEVPATEESTVDSSGIAEIINSTRENAPSTEASEEAMDESFTYTYSRPELTAYGKVLSKYLKDKGGEFGADLIYIDEDDTYELAIINGDAASDGAYLYTFKDGNAISLESKGFPFYGSYGAFSYSKKNNYFCYDYSSTGGDSGRFMFFAFHIEDAKTVNECSLDRTFYFSDDSKNVFYNQGEQITEAVYDSLYQKYWYDYINDDLTDLDYYHCTSLSSVEEIDAFLKSHEQETDTSEYSEGELKAMTPEQLFEAFCAGRARAEYLNPGSDGEKRYVNTSYYDFNEHGDATDVVIIQDPVDLDNDGEVEFILLNPVYGTKCFDCKDGRIFFILYQCRFF